MKWCIGLYFLIWLAVPSFAASDADIDKATTYAAILGRAAACGVGTDDEARRVGAWIDRTFAGDERTMQLIIFMEGMKMNAQNQAEGRSPDSCATVRRVYGEMIWP